MSSRDQRPDPLLLWLGDTIENLTVVAAAAAPLAVLVGLGWWLLR